MIDAHVLAWGAEAAGDCPSMGWMPAQLRQQFPQATLDSVLPEMVAAGVSGLVLSQVCNSIAHTDAQLAMAESADVPTKVVGWLPLDNPTETTQILERYADEPALVSVQHRLSPSDDQDFLINPAVAQSLNVVAAAGMRLDIIPTQTESLLLVPDLVRAHPDLPLAVNMLGWPDVEHQRMQPWTDYFSAVGALPSVFFKVCSTHMMNGVLTEVADMAPYLDIVINIFGVDRIMVGSNWPVTTQHFASYQESMVAVEAVFAQCTSHELEQVMELTAAKFYGF